LVVLLIVKNEIYRLALLLDFD